MTTAQESLLPLLLNQLFDYAGMFPPAALSFEAAVQESCVLPRTLRRPWLVGSDLVLDTANARALSTRAPSELGFSHTPRVCLLATEDPPTVLTVARSLSESRTASSRYSISSLEVRVGAADVNDIVAAYGDFSKSHSCILAIEPDLSTEHWQDELARCVQAIENLTPRYPRLALKVRCSGPTGLNAHKLAHVIATTCDNTLHFKATAGLHHPVVEQERYNNTFGFLNLVIAVMLRRALRDAIGVSALERLVTNESTDRLNVNGIVGFDSFSISREQLHAAKQAAHFSIGSCSLAEPDADLSRLFPE
jgi:hypothetical protein